MYNYNTVSEAVQGLSARGFTESFSLENDHLSSAALNLRLHPDHFEVIETHRFEGDTDPADEAVVYAIASKNGLKGVMVNAYGPYADSISAELIKKLS
ncbi:MAG: phosphoribosylpyrophosphate synthetase [Cytophagaceae bacterium]|nr:phosphoribosylpyrophosphate synthetase [Cytophagaceae bacterium]